MIGPNSCPGPIDRRGFLRAGLFGWGGLTLPGLLTAQAVDAPPTTDTSVILFWMWGGPSHLETYDLKPDAPAEYRGPFSPIRTTVPGLDVCELLPLHARTAKRFSLVRSLHHTMSSHNDGSIEVLTGKTPTKADPTSTAISEHPDFGMITSYLRGHADTGLPQYVGVPHAPFMTRPNYLGLGYNAFTSGDPTVPTFAPPNLRLNTGNQAGRFSERRSLLQEFDAMRRNADWRGAMQGTDELRGRAFDMLTSPKAAQAFDLGKEDPKLRDRYGRHPWGQSCLLARRLAEAGVGAITVDATAPLPGQRIYFSWDDHADAQPGWDMARGLRWRSPYLDQALTALIDDIYDRGLDRKILVVAMGEFGRGPLLTKLNGNIGRNHWPDAMAALVSGGGLRMGQVVGATNSKGEYPKENPLTPQDLLATVYKHLGIDYHRQLIDFSGRPVAVLGEGKPIADLV